MHGLRVQLQIGLVNRKGKMMFDIGLDLQKAFDEGYEKGKADRPQGEWIDEADKYDASFGIHDYRCSNCNSYADEYIGGHEWYTAGKPNFCPYCGADMRSKIVGKHADFMMIDEACAKGADNDNA